MTPALNGEREGARPLRNLLAESSKLLDLAAGSLGLEVLELVGLLGEGVLDLTGSLDSLRDVSGNALKLLLTETTAGHGGGTNADTVRGQGTLVTRDGVLVAGNVDLLENGLDTGAVELVFAEVEEDHVGVGAVGNELVAEGLERFLELFGVGNNLLLVSLEVRSGSLLEGNGKSGDAVVVRTTLVTREDGEVDGTLEVVESLLALGIDGANTLAEEDHGTTGTTEGLVGSGGDDIGVLEGGGDDLSGNETRNVSHVDNKVGTNGVGNLAHALVIDETAVSRGSGNEDLGAEQLGVLLELVVVDDASLDVDTVGHGLEVGGDSRDPVHYLVRINRETKREEHLEEQHTCEQGSGNHGTSDHREGGQDPSDGRERA